MKWHADLWEVFLCKNFPARPGCMGFCTRAMGILIDHLKVVFRLGNSEVKHKRLQLWIGG